MIRGTTASTKRDISVQLRAYPHIKRPGSPPIMRRSFAYIRRHLGVFPFRRTAASSQVASSHMSIDRSLPARHWRSTAVGSIPTGEEPVDMPLRDVSVVVPCASCANDAARRIVAEIRIPRGTPQSATSITNARRRRCYSPHRGRCQPAGAVDFAGEGAWPEVKRLARGSTAGWRRGVGGAATRTRRPPKPSQPHRAYINGAVAPRTVAASPAAKFRTPSDDSAFAETAAASQCDARGRSSYAIRRSTRQCAPSVRAAGKRRRVQHCGLFIQDAHSFERRDVRERRT
jgi:hypothetical protein